MNWQLVPQFGIAGLLAGGPIALIALGIVLIYKATYIFNFAQGQLLLLGALFTWFFALELGWPIGISIVLALVLAALLGLLIERFALRPMTGQPIFAIVLMTLGLAQFLQGVALLLFGGTQRNFPHLFSIENPYRISMPFYFNGNQITVILKQNLVWSFVVAILAVVLIGAFFQFSRTGLAMRATSEDHELAQSVGLRIRRIFGASWAMAAMVATVAGVLLATSSGLDMSLSLVVLSAFATVLLGGLDSIPGTIVGGLIIGASIGLTKASTVPLIRDMSEIMPYIVLLVVLLIRPEGIFGQRRIERI